MDCGRGVSVEICCVGSVSGMGCSTGCGEERQPAKNNKLNITNRLVDNRILFMPAQLYFPSCDG
jgi:hypothetical protein